MSASKLISITGLLVGASLFVLWQTRERGDQNEDHSIERELEGEGGSKEAPPQGDLIGQADDASLRQDASVVSEPPPAKDVPEVVAPTLLTERDIEYIRANLEGLYANAGRAELVEGYRSSVRMLPKGFINDLHKEHIAEGRYEVLDHPITKKGASYSPPEIKGSPVAHGLIRVGVLEDGRSVKTELELSELGEYASLAVELGWFEGAIGRAAGKERGERKR